ncbi:unnamed protein product [Rotaria sordida]|uniref:Uncharacterized protein n=2 Tax=Rotaria sordida TaxID=392033 RepID=A0A816A6R5_9BILA|nr:unnamed protein product [Rotaria sordida]
MGNYIVKKESSNTENPVRRKTRFSTQLTSNDVATLQSEYNLNENEVEELRHKIRRASIQSIPKHFPFV